MDVLLLGSAGMLGGLALDVGHGGLGALGSLCLANPADVAGVLLLHWHMLPAMHLGMFAGGLAAVWLRRLPAGSSLSHFRGRLVRSLACSTWMVAGMAVAAVVFTRTSAGARSAPAMLACMFLGMVLAMAAGAALARLGFAALGIFRLRARAQRRELLPAATVSP